MIAQANADDLVSIVLLDRAAFPPPERWSGESWAAEVGHDDHLVLVHRARGDDSVAESVGSGDGPAPARRTDENDGVTALWRSIAPSSMAAIDAVAAFSVADDFGDLLRVIVAPSAQRQGLATALIRAGLDWMAGKGATRVLLEVSQHNEAGLALYSGLGFERLTTRRDYYGPGLDAWVMIRPVEEQAHE